MAKKLTNQEKIKAHQKAIKDLKQKEKEIKNKKYVDFVLDIEKAFKKYPKFDSQELKKWVISNVDAMAKAMHLELAPEPTQQNKPTTPPTNNATHH